MCAAAAPSLHLQIDAFLAHLLHFHTIHSAVIVEVRSIHACMSHAYTQWGASRMKTAELRVVFEDCYRRFETFSGLFSP